MISLIVSSSSGGTLYIIKRVCFFHSHRVLIRCHPRIISTSTMPLRYRRDGGFEPRIRSFGDNASTLSLADPRGLFETKEK